MYKKVRLNQKEGKWEDISDHKSTNGFSANGDNEYIFYVGEMPKDKTEQTKIAQDVIKANTNEITRVTIGASFSASSNSPSSCPGSCYCVVSGNSRHCETCYCNDNGYCWCVNCSGSC